MEQEIQKLLRQIDTQKFAWYGKLPRKFSTDAVGDEALIEYEKYLEEMSKFIKTSVEGETMLSGIQYYSQRTHGQEEDVFYYVDASMERDWVGQLKRLHSSGHVEKDFPLRMAVMASFAYAVDPMSFVKFVKFQSIGSHGGVDVLHDALQSMAQEYDVVMINYLVRNQETYRQLFHKLSKKISVDEALQRRLQRMEAVIGVAWDETREAYVEAPKGDGTSVSEALRAIQAWRESLVQILSKVGDHDEQIELHSKEIKQLRDFIDPYGQPTITLRPPPLVVSPRQGDVSPHGVKRGKAVPLRYIDDMGVEREILEYNEEDRYLIYADDSDWGERQVFFDNVYDVDQRLVYL